MKFNSIVISLLLLLAFASPGLATEQVFYYITDPAGTPLAMTDEKDNVVWRADYKPFGEEQAVSGTAENSKRFVGKEKDEETGLSYFGARYEDAKTGRFIAVDPVRVVDPMTSKTNERLLLNPQRLNVYAYALNNPYRYLDPDGRESRSVNAGIAILGMGSNAFGLVVGFGLSVTPEPTMLTKVAAVAVTAKSSYGLVANYNNLLNTLNGQEPSSTGGLGTDLANVVAPGNKTIKAMGTVSELSLDILTGSAGRAASSNSLGVLNSYAMERTFVRNPAELGKMATGVQLGDLVKTGTEAHRDLK